MSRIPCPLRTDPRIRALIESATLVGRRYFRDGQPVHLCKEIQAIYPTVDAHAVCRAVREISGREVKKQLNPAKRAKTAQESPQAIADSTDEPDNQPAPSVKPNVKESQSRTCERYEIVRRVSRRNGECSWGVLDSQASENTIVFVGDNLREALDECERLNSPPQKWAYKRGTGPVGYFSDDD